MGGFGFVTQEGGGEGTGGHLSQKKVIILRLSSRIFGLAWTRACQQQNYTILIFKKKTSFYRTVPCGLLLSEECDARLGDDVWPREFTQLGEVIDVQGH